MRGVRCDPERREARCLKRYVPWQDARVLTIFEGAEEVLALRVVARHLLRDQEGAA